MSERIYASDGRFIGVTGDEKDDRIAELEAENARLRGVLGSVAEHDRSLGAHIAAAMKKYDAGETP